MNVESDTYIYPFINTVEKINELNINSKKDIKILDSHLDEARLFAIRSKVFEKYIGKPSDDNSNFLKQIAKLISKLNENEEYRKHILREKNKTPINNMKSNILNLRRIYKN